MPLRKILPLLFFVTMLAGKLSAQIYAPAANDSFSAAYNPPGGTDKVFVINKPTYKADITASIIAVSIDKLSGWAFQWSVFDPVTKVYGDIPMPGSGWFSEIDTITVSSGYQVVMTKGADINIYRVWMLFNDLDLNITNKDGENKLLFGYYNCSSLDLRADTTHLQLFYFDPVTKGRIIPYNPFVVRWKTDNDEASIPPNRLTTRVTSPPSEDTWYKLTLTDNFGLTRSDSVFYESIQSKAEMKSVYIPLSDPVEYPVGDYGRFYGNEIKSAPGKYRFDVTGSRNMASYEIDFGDDSIFVSEGDILEVVHEYQKPGKYAAVLTTKSDKPYECIDSVSVVVDLDSASSKNFQMPNFFTPEGLNNKVFRCADISVRHIDITIFNRAGLKMHSYEGNIRDWEGWDGLVRNSQIKAPEGVYFYVITVFKAYEDKSNPIGSSVKKGFFHLYR